MVGVNRVGSDKANIYNGQSMIVDPFGDKLFIPTSAEAIFYSKIELQKVIDVRMKYPFLEDIKLI